MRIVAIESITDDAHPALIWVRLHTDDGQIGLGETAGLPSAVEAVLHDLLPSLLIGEDPRQINLIWQRCFRTLAYRGVGGAELRALSAVDIALWDLLGKTTGQPLSVLLGGRVREEVPVYNTCGSYGKIDDRTRFLEEPGELARELLDVGISRMKIWPFDDYAQMSDGNFIAPDELRAGVERVKKIADATERKMEVAVEGHGLWSLPAAVSIARALEPFDPMWIEDLVWPENPGVLGSLRAATRVPVIASERTMTAFGVAALIDAGACDIVMTDLAWTGGLTEGRRIAAYASAWMLPVAPHNCGGPIGHVAALHFCAHIPNLMPMETIRAFYEGFYSEIITDSPRPLRGRIAVPDRPGLGVELSTTFLESPGTRSRVSSQATDDSVGLSRRDPWTTARF